MRQIVFLLALLALGCQNTPATSPSAQSAVSPQSVVVSIGDPTADDAMLLVSTEHVANGILATYKSRDGIRTAKLLYTKEGTLVCDYPIGFIGPIPYGHAREDGTT